MKPSVQRNHLQYLLANHLSRAEQLVVILYYYEKMTAEEISLQLELSSFRVNEMRLEILERLRNLSYTYSYERAYESKSFLKLWRK